jgi:hypothetical protein
MLPIDQAIKTSSDALLAWRQNRREIVKWPNPDGSSGFQHLNDICGKIASQLREQPDMVQYAFIIQLSDQVEANHPALPIMIFVATRLFTEIRLQQDAPGLFAPVDYTRLANMLCRYWEKHAKDKEKKHIVDQLAEAATKALHRKMDSASIPRFWEESESFRNKYVPHIIFPRHWDEAIRAWQEQHSSESDEIPDVYSYTQLRNKEASMRRPQARYSQPPFLPYQRGRSRTGY